MQRFVFLLAVSLALGFSAPTFAADATPTVSQCPSDIRAAVEDACKCDSFRTHGKYITCVQRKLDDMKKLGCDAKQLRHAAKCASSSICGKEKKQLVVCCSKKGRAKIATADRCNAKQATIKTGVNSLCDAACDTKSSD